MLFTTDFITYIQSNTGYWHFSGGFEAYKGNPNSQRGRQV